tara:strand:- start:278 stop:604 length:327 start_codon:yes stop_codon:yes gene_type:complete
MNVWYLIFLCGLLTFLIRFFPMSGIFNFQGSELYIKVINLIPIVVLTPIITQALMFDKSATIINSVSFEIICSFLAVLISILFKNVMITILLSMMFFLILTNIPFFNG